jgi:DNA invertase Pin-like site-specific DNA recombinase
MARKSRKPEVLQTAQAASISTGETVYKTGIYARLSVLDSKNDSESIVNQQDMLTQYIAGHPELMLQSVFVDNGESGTDFFRPAWNDLILACKAGKINCIVVKDLSRVGRNYIETGDYLEKILPPLGVRLIAVNDAYDSLNITVNQQLVANLKNLVNDLYAKDISRKACAAKRIQKESGAFIGSYAAYGYMKTPEDKNAIIVDPETAPIVQQIFQWKAEGMGNTHICRRLSDAGIPSPNRYRYLKGFFKDERYDKCRWGLGTIVSVLENPVYLGKMTQGKFAGALYEGKKHRRTNKQDWIIKDSTHEPIITQELFDRVQSIMELRKAISKALLSKSAFPNKPEHLLKGLVYCGDCGRPLSRIKYMSKDKQSCKWIYVCPTSHILKSCLHKYVRETDLINAVYDAIRLEIVKCSDISGIIEKLNRESSHKTRLMRFDAEIEAAEREIKRIGSLRQGVFEDYAAKLLTVSEYKFAVGTYNMDAERQHERLEAARHDKMAYTQMSTPMNKWLTAFSRFMDARELTAEMARALVVRIIIKNRNCVEICFNFKDEYEAVCGYSGYES